MNKIKDYKILKTLYTLKSFGYKYIDSIDTQNSYNNTISLPNDLNLLNNIVNNCTLCSFSKHRKNVLFSYGKASSKIMIVTFSPTELEDSEGRFYTGKAGELIYNIVTKVFNYNIDDVYITSLSKCRVVYNDNNLTDNINICKNYLLKQIELLNPKIILFFGQNVYEYMIECDNFEQIKGNIFEWANYKVLATYEHMHILKNPTLKKEVFESMLKVKNFMESNNV